MPAGENVIPLATMKEAAVPFHRKVRNRAWLSGLPQRVRSECALIGEFMSSMADSSSDRATFILMIVLRRCKSVGQTHQVRWQRTEPGARKPTVQKKCTRLAIPTDIGPKIEEPLLANASKRQGQWIKLAGPKVSHGHRHHADATEAVE